MNLEGKNKKCIILIKEYIREWRGKGGVRRSRPIGSRATPPWRGGPTAPPPHPFVPMIPCQGPPPCHLPLLGPTPATRHHGRAAVPCNPPPHRRRGGVEVIGSQICSPVYFFFPYLHPGSEPPSSWLCLRARRRFLMLHRHFDCLLSCPPPLSSPWWPNLLQPTLQR